MKLFITGLCFTYWHCSVGVMVQQGLWLRVRVRVMVVMLLALHSALCTTLPAESETLPVNLMHRFF